MCFYLPSRSCTRQREVELKMLNFYCKTVCTNVFWFACWKSVCFLSLLSWSGFYDAPEVGLKILNSPRLQKDKGQCFLSWLLKNDRMYVCVCVFFLTFLILLLRYTGNREVGLKIWNSPRLQKGKGQCILSWLLKDDRIYVCLWLSLVFYLVFTIHRK